MKIPLPLNWAKHPGDWEDHAEYAERIKGFELEALTRVEFVARPRGGRVLSRLYLEGWTDLFAEVEFRNAEALAEFTRDSGLTDGLILMLPQGRRRVSVLVAVPVMPFLLKYYALPTGA